VPFIGRLDKERLYDLHWRKPRPLVARRDCLGAPGRIGHEGDELEPLDPEGLDALAEQARALADGEDELDIAVCLLFSYLQPDHERVVASALGEALPGAPISVSHEVSPLWREYERSSTPIADAFVKPVVDRYVEGVGAVLRGGTGLERWNLLASNGGYLRADQARRRPAQLLLSGLAGGVIGAAFHARRAGYPSVFSLDMGGTSCDIGLVVEGEQQYATEFDLAFGLPVSIPCVSVRTIGAGGGSIAWVDEGGLLHVGPRSAGAEPGPAAYGRGGTDATVTDANLVLGRLDPGAFLGGAMSLDGDAAREAVARVGAGVGLDAVATASAIARTTDENMANAIRLIGVERGLDPRDFALIAFGGAGPLHARAVAERLGMRTVLVPPQPGLCSALGAAIARARVDRVRTFSARSASVDLDRLAAAERELRAEAAAELAASVGAVDAVLVRAAAMRYEGQNYELEVGLPSGDIDARTWAQLLERFEAEHGAQYGFALPGEAVELINLRVTAYVDEPLLPTTGVVDGAVPPATRSVHFGAEGPVDCPVHQRGALSPGDEVLGPAIVQETDSTMLLWPGDRMLVLESGVAEITLP
jgi:N-methylhydantoinase A